ncbi:MAG: 2-dehydropantoate 2-reductase N-terminal domain-containing protein, partial [Solirubrobacteraceae bacterium]
MSMMFDTCTSSCRSTWGHRNRIAEADVESPPWTAPASERNGAHPSRAPSGSLGAVAKIAVLGAGGVGGLVAAALARAGEDVVVVAREETAELISRSGIEVRSAALGPF